ncbi:hypothetical protein OEW28_09520 [Defluviimonas sp. WL0002]|uniref:Uncharacterized protein n=1 Tax=Albidovulum marisflavi TaxID=2984159 RepID=A0ABT2ZCP9_9RHOB|nr:hypothetical protein [Defluviimonas sp. WL0002]MCV2868866.1 hypothetical protein [Defluviimonas sp. WL0002]
MKAASESRKIWVEAKDSVDAGIERLVARLAKESDPELGEIAGAIRDLASAGLPGISDGAQTELLSGIMELEGGAPAAASLAKSLAALQRYRAALSGNPFIEICEENPFGVNVPITATMTGALDEMEKRLSAA